MIPTALQLVIQNFNGIRAVACTQRTSNSSYCVPEILYAAQNATGTQFNISTLTSLANAGTGNTLNFLEGVPQDIYCGDCGNAVVTEGESILHMELFILKYVRLTAVALLSSSVHSLTSSKCSTECIC